MKNVAERKVETTGKLFAYSCPYPLPPLLMSVSLPHSTDCILPVEFHGVMIELNV